MIPNEPTARAIASSYFWLKNDEPREAVAMVPCLTEPRSQAVKKRWALFRGGLTKLKEEISNLQCVSCLIDVRTPQKWLQKILGDPMKTGALRYVQLNEERQDKPQRMILACKVQTKLRDCVAASGRPGGNLALTKSGDGNVEL